MADKFVENIDNYYVESQHDDVYSVGGLSAVTLMSSVEVVRCRCGYTVLLFIR